MTDATPALPDDAEIDRTLAQLRCLARWMDEAVQLPLIGGVGLDALIGVIPGVGDLITAAIAWYFARRAAQLGVEEDLRWPLLRNLLVDLLVGTVPLLGDLFDVMYRANSRNLALVEDALLRRKAASSA